MYGVKRRIFSKKYVVPVCLVICIVLISVFCLKLPSAKGYSFVSSVPITDITDKFYSDDYYVTVVLEDDIVEEYSLKHNQLTIPVNKDIYNQVVVNDGFAGITLQVTVPSNQPKTDIGMVLKEERAEYCRIVSVTDKDNIVLD